VKRETPVQKERFKRNADQMTKLWKQFQLAGLFAFEARLALEAYYGGPFRSCWEQFKQVVWLDLQGKRHSTGIWISDKLGWTKICHVPETKDYRAHSLRHGGRCHGSPNCSQECIGQAIPKWFKTVFGIEH
jgi:hypothetical protein